MRKLAVLLGGLMVAGLLAPSALGQAGGGGAGGRRGNAAGGAGAGGGGAAATPRVVPSPFQNQLDQMDKELKLTDDEKTKIKALIDTMNTEIKDLQTDIATQRQALMRGAFGQGGAQTPEERDALRKKMQDQATKNQDEYQTLVNENQAKVDAALTPEQRLTWEAFKLKTAFLARAASLDLTDDQKTKVGDIAKEFAQALADLKDAKDLAAYNTIYGKFYRKVIIDVLTEVQAGKLIAQGQPLLGGTAGGGGPGGFGGGGFGGGGFGGGRGGPGGGGGGGGRRGGGGGAPGAGIP